MKPDRNRIRQIVYDFDGVMTDNHVYVNQNGEEMAMMHRGDGLGVGIIRSLGIDQMILSTETNPIVMHRARKLGLEVIHDVKDKAEALKEYCAGKGIDLSGVMYIGNDTNDLAAMKLCGFKGAPADAEPEILAIADWVSGKCGGMGVVRELARILSEGAE
ncbi:MAG: HAD hydrolase family protein [Lachnospiraceae bacterium]|nr:HAD hydrolase family protein [Lachnospiraceae bacterium]